TGEQWACLETRMPNLQRSRADVVRVPLSACDQGSNTRGVTRSTASASHGVTTPAPTDPRLTRAPLYLTKAQLECIGRQLPRLREADGPATVELSGCVS